MDNEFNSLFPQEPNNSKPTSHSTPQRPISGPTTRPQPPPGPPHTSGQPHPTGIPPHTDPSLPSGSTPDRRPLPLRTTANRPPRSPGPPLPSDQRPSPSQGSLFEPPPSTDIETDTVTLPDKNTRKAPSSPANSDEGLIKTADHEPHVTLTKRFTLLIVVFIVMVSSGIGTAAWSIHQNKYGYPPTEFSQTAYSNTIFALISLFLVSLFSIIVLRGKIHHLAIGYMVMFLYVLTFYFALKGASRAYISIQYDDIVTIEKYMFNNSNDKTEGELPQFFHRLQSNFKCCGTSNVDKMEDWPKRLQTKDIPHSCCKKDTATCGKLLARTYDYDGGVDKPMRIPSGYFLSLTENEMDGIVRTRKPVKIVRPSGKDKGQAVVLKVLREFYFKSLAEGYPPGTPVDKMRRTPNDIIEPFDVAKNNLPTAIGCRDNASLEMVTTIGWKVQYLLDLETSILHSKSSPVKYDWMAWKIPMCQEIGGVPPFHLASNFKREVINPREHVKMMWYISRGVTENFLLQNDIWPIQCEKVALPDIPLAQKIIGSDRKRTGATIGNFYIYFVNRLMIACLFISAVVAVALFIVFIIFWMYYSRMKLEDYANLPYPPEFEVLRVKQSDLYEKHDKAEYDKEKYKELKAKEEEEEEAAKDSIDYEGIREQFDRMFGGPSAPPAPQSKPAAAAPGSRPWNLQSQDLLQ